MVLNRADSYEALYSNFRWNIPNSFNMGVDVCDKNAARYPDRAGLIVVEPGKNTINYSFNDLKRLSNQLANLFIAKGLERGERVAILMSQSVEVAISHVAAWKMAAISIPLFTLFGEDALRFRLQDSKARMLVTDLDNLPKIEAIREELPHLQTIFVVGQGVEDGSKLDFWSSMAKAIDTFPPVETGREDPSFISYTSGTTGNPKGALHAHRTIFGHLIRNGNVPRFFTGGWRSYVDAGRLGLGRWTNELSNLLVASRRHQCRLQSAQV